MSEMSTSTPAVESTAEGVIRPASESASAFGVIAVLGGVLAAVAVISLDVVLGGEPLRGRTRRQQTISEYIYSSGAWAFNLALLLLAVGSVALILGLVRRRLSTPLSAGSIFLTLWVIGLAGIIAFPKHNWAVGPSTSGSVHRAASLIAFLAVPVGVLLIARPRRHAESAAARTAFWLAIGGFACLAVLLGAILVAAITGGSWWQLIPLGLIERGLIGFDVASVVAVGVWLIRGSQSAHPAEPVRPTPAARRPALPGS